jgi:hypothetical protein
MKILLLVLILCTPALAGDKQQDCFQQSQAFIWSCLAGGQTLSQCTQQAATYYCECMGWPPGCNGAAAMKQMNKRQTGTGRGQQSARKESPNGNRFATVRLHNRGSQSRAANLSISKRPKGNAERIQLRGLRDPGCGSPPPWYW